MITAKGRVSPIHFTKGIISSPFDSIKPIKIRFGGVPIGVIMPPILAPYAIARINLTFIFISSTKNEAIGIKSNAVVVLDKNEPLVVHHHWSKVFPKRR
jgi:hypothetical protein